MPEKNDDLMKKMFRVEGLLHRYYGHNFRNHGPFGNPLRGQGRVLSILKIKPQITQKELCYLLDMRQQSLSELLIKLESRGLVTRTASEEDKRVIIITLTEEGKKIADDVEGNEFKIGRVFECLTAEEQQNLGNYLERLAASLEAELDIEENGQEDEGCKFREHGFRGPWEHDGHELQEHFRNIHHQHHRVMGHHGFPGEGFDHRPPMPPEPNEEDFED